MLWTATRPRHLAPRQHTGGARRRWPLAIVTVLAMVLTGCAVDHDHSTDPSGPPSAKALRVLESGYSLLKARDGGRRMVTYGAVLKNTSKTYTVDGATVRLRFTDAAGKPMVRDVDGDPYETAVASGVAPGERAVVTGVATLVAGSNHRPAHLKVVVPDGSLTDNGVAWAPSEQVGHVPRVVASSVRIEQARRHTTSVRFSISPTAVPGGEPPHGVAARVLFRNSENRIVGGYPTVKVGDLEEESGRFVGSFAVVKQNLPSDWAEHRTEVHLAIEG